MSSSSSSSLPPTAPALHQLLDACDSVDEMIGAVSAASPSQMFARCDACAPSRAQQPLSQVEGSVALHVAARRGIERVTEAVVSRIRAITSAEEFLEQVNARRKDGATPLLLSCAGGHCASARVLLHADANPNTSTTQGTTPLIAAAFYGHTDVVRELLSHKSTNVRAKDAKGMDALICACAHGRHDITRMLLHHPDIDVNSRKNDDVTPFIVASQQGDDQMVRILLEHGVDTTVRTRSGWNAMHVACLGGHVHVASTLHAARAEFLESALPDGTTPLYIACSKSHQPLVEWLIRQQARVDIVRTDGNTLLHAAVKPTEHAHRVLHILHQCAPQLDPYQKNVSGQHAVFLAAATGSKDIQAAVDRWVQERPKGAVAPPPAAPAACLVTERFHELLEQACLSHEAQQACESMIAADAALCRRARSTGRTPLCTVCAVPKMASANKHAVVAMLLHRGADPLDRDGRGWNALHFAASDNDTISCRMLLASGVDRDVRSNEGASPAFAASAHGCIHSLHLLLAHGADPNARCADGATPIFIASQSNDVAVIRILLAHGANPSTPLLDGRSSLSIACRMGHTSVVRLLLRVMRRRARGLSALQPHVMRTIMERTASFAAPASHNESCLPRRMINQQMAEEGYLFPEDEMFPDQDYNSAQALREQSIGRRVAATANDPNDDGDTAWLLEEDDDGVTRATLAERGAVPILDRRPNATLDAFMQLKREGEQEDTITRMIQLGASHAAEAVAGWRAFEEPEPDPEEAHRPALALACAVDGCPDLEAPDQAGMTPLHIACMYNQPKIARLLIRHGANMHALDRGRRNALWIAAARGHAPVALQLLDYAGRRAVDLITELDARNMSALFLACQESLHTVVSAMFCRPIRDLAVVIRRGAFDGRTPLFAACYAGCADIVRSLVLNGADVKQIVPGGKICLHVACERGYLNVVSALLKRPHSVSIVMRGIEIARQHGHAEIVEFLSELVPITEAT